MPEPSPRAIPAPEVAARAAAVRRWTLILAGVWLLLLLWRVAGALRHPEAFAWRDVTLPLSMLALFAATPLKHRRPLYVAMMATSFALLAVTLASLLRPR
ncbi:MAG TPA: hypothetical protein VEZ47_00225 [Gemmatirosa sp.]|nr:hypothetical protein [Gemmatirosa sp.]